MIAMAATASEHQAACAGNQGSSYMTIMSLGGLEFGILNILGSFGLVWCISDCPVHVATRPAHRLQDILTCIKCCLLSSQLCMPLAGLISRTGRAPLLPLQRPHGRGTCSAPCCGSASPSRLPQARPCTLCAAMANIWLTPNFFLVTRVPIYAGLGIAAVALDLPVSSDEANMGLVPIAAAQVRTSTIHNLPRPC